VSDVDERPIKPEHLSAEWKPYGETTSCYNLFHFLIVIDWDMDGGTVETGQSLVWLRKGDTFIPAKGVRTMGQLNQFVEAFDCIRY
jgi:hypothetical protein